MFPYHSVQGQLTLLTRTGVAYALASNPQNGLVSFVRQLPPSHNRFKTPWRISYPHEQQNSLRWGFGIQPGSLAYSWTKLLLDVDVNPAPLDDGDLRLVLHSELMQLPEDKEAVVVVSDFLRQVYAHITRHLTAVAHLPTEFWFTVPAIWSDNARALMGQAVRNAGFGLRQPDRVLMIAESPRLQQLRSSILQRAI